MDATAADQGIWVWSSPVYNDFKNTNLFFIDLVEVDPKSEEYPLFLLVLLQLTSVLLVAVPGDHLSSAAAGVPKDLVQATEVLKKVSAYFEADPKTRYSEAHQPKPLLLPPPEHHLGLPEPRRRQAADRPRPRRH